MHALPCGTEKMAREIKDRFQSAWFNYIWQPLTAVVFMSIVLFILNALATSSILWAVGAGALASSCFVVFGQPFSSNAFPHRIIGGYFIGIGMGGLMRIISEQLYLFQKDFLVSPHFQTMGILAAVTVGLALFFMTLFRLQHPPATGMALVLVLDVRDYKTMFVVFFAATALALLRIVLKKQLIDLV